MSTQHTEVLDRRIGTGNWEAFPHSLLDDVYEAAASWREQLVGIDKPWLCWCVDSDWCVLQQKLVSAAGWTPVVGVDKPTLTPHLIAGSVFVNFNRTLKLPSMWMHFPLEFAFLFAKRLAFWHSDVLPTREVMEHLAADFETIQDGEYWGTRRAPGFFQIMRRLRRAVRQRRFASLASVTDGRWFEVIGCTSQAASQSQFDHGCGFWRHIEKHPNFIHKHRSSPYYEHGTGLWYWEKYHGGLLKNISIDIEPYHYTTKENRIKTEGELNKREEMRRKYNVDELARRLGL